MAIGNTVSRLGLAAMLAGLTMRTGAAAGEVIGWVDVNPSAGQVEIIGRAFAQSGATIDYTLKLDRSGSSGNSATTQRGQVTLEAGKAMRLGKASVNLAPRDELDILLTISSAGKVVGTTQIRIGQ